LCAVRVGGPPSPAEPEPEPDAIHDSGPADAAAGAAIVTSAAAKPAATKRAFMFSHFLRWNQTKSDISITGRGVARTVGQRRGDAPRKVRACLAESGRSGRSESGAERVRVIVENATCLHLAAPLAFRR